MNTEDQEQREGVPGSSSLGECPQSRAPRSPLYSSADDRPLKFRAFDGLRMRSVRKVIFDAQGWTAFLGHDDIEGDRPGHIASNNPREWNRALMQFTGLRDKDGREIYEGDILRGSQMDAVEGNCEVCYIDGMLSLRVGDRVRPCSTTERTRVGWCLAGRGTYGPLEVIGNIYESGDLLRVSDRKGGEAALSAPSVEQEPVAKPDMTCGTCRGRLTWRDGQYHHFGAMMDRHGVLIAEPWEEAGVVHPSPPEPAPRSVEEEAKDWYINDYGPRENLSGPEPETMLNAFWQYMQGKASGKLTALPVEKIMREVFLAVHGIPVPATEKRWHKYLRSRLSALGNQ